MNIKKLLQFLSRSFASLLFTAAFFILFASIFSASLFENLPTLEVSIQEQFGSDFIIEQLAKESGLTKEQIMNICKENPAQEGCDQINDPQIFSSKAVADVEKQLDSYKSVISSLKPFMILFFILSLVFYYLGTVSVYASLFKISVNILISAVFGYLAFASLPGILPSAIEQGFEIASPDISAEISSSLKEGIAVIVTEWLKNPIVELKTLFIYLIIFSLLTSILFYFLKRKYSKKD